jgi:hypothetical protein
MRTIGEEEVSAIGTTMMCWDVNLVETIRESDPAREIRIDLEFYSTSTAALWGCNAVTVKAAAKLTADSECLQCFSAQHRDGLLQAIERAVCCGIEPHEQPGKALLITYISILLYNTCSTCALWP